MRNAPLPFLALWFLLAVIPGGLAELTSDEAYYWFYTTSLQWGYYDHPPFLALMIRAGTLLFPGELGVRFVTAALSTMGLLIVFKARSRWRVPTSRFAASVSLWRGLSRTILTVCG